MLKQYEDNGLIHGFRVARGTPSVSHLFFADDCYFFFKASQAEATIVRSILQKYECVGTSGEL